MPDCESPVLHLSQPDSTSLELDWVAAALQQPRWSHGGPLTEAFEERFARHAGRRHAVAVASGTLGLWLVLRSLGLQPEDEVIAAPYSWHQLAHAAALAGVRLQLADIDYWSGCLDAARAANRITPRSRVLLACNVNGHPADWQALRALAQAHHLTLVEDASESIASRYQGQGAGSFGDIAVFDFSQPQALCCGEGGMLVTDDAALASEWRYLRARAPDQRRSVSIGARLPAQAALSEVAAALGLAQLARLGEILQRRQQVSEWYLQEMQSFEGIKPPYLAAGVEQVDWMLHKVHLGKRFTASATLQIVEDMAQEGIETALYCQPLHQQFHYQQMGWQRGQFPLTERIADRAIALPFHGGLTHDEVHFIVARLKDACTNVGAGAAIY